MGQDNRIYVSDAFNSRVSIYQLINTTAEDSLVTQPSKKEEGGDSGRPEQTNAAPRKGGDPEESQTSLPQLSDPVLNQM
jgi:hypothetical protein